MKILKDEINGMGVKTMNPYINLNRIEFVITDDPYNNPASRAVLNGGVSELVRYAESQDITVGTNDCRSACGVCRKVMNVLKEKARA